MRKDAYFFPHDSNAKDDPKCSMLIEQLGLEGYGIYWVLIETLRDQPGYHYPLVMLPIVARKYNTTADKVRAVVDSFGLFVIENDEFFSLSLCCRMEKVDKLRKLNSAKGRIGGGRKKSPPEEDPSLDEPDMNGGLTAALQRKQNETKAKESKEEKTKEEKRKEKEIIAEVLDYLNEKAETRFRPVAANEKHIAERLHEGYSPRDFWTVINKKCAEWMGTEQQKYLRPETLFGPKFDGYLNQCTRPRTCFDFLVEMDREEEPYDPADE